MIQKVLPIIINELNTFFQSEYGATSDKVRLSNIVDHDGSIVVEGSNQVIATLINIEEERITKASSQLNRSNAGFFSSAGSVKLNLKILFTAYFNPSNYLEALKFISGVVYFFQQKSAFEARDFFGSDFPDERVVFELETLPYAELNNIFSMMGLKYMPSVIYKMRMLTMDLDRIVKEIPEVTGFDVNEE